jgi:hypothetical protein
MYVQIGFLFKTIINNSQKATYQKGEREKDDGWEIQIMYDSRMLRMENKRITEAYIDRNDIPD